MRATFEIHVSSNEISRCFSRWCVVFSTTAALTVLPVLICADRRLKSVQCSCSVLWIISRPSRAAPHFLNSDKVAHNVFWPSVGGNKKLGHNLGTWPQGEKRSFKFDTAGAVPLLCNVHPEMAGYIVVAPTPFFAKTDKSGEYKIDNVPDGSYTVVAWHEGAKNESKPVTVSGDTKADFTLSK